ncbi:hypothetical protein F4677DRAFT_181956 [Hypoxylon crocopeplum]|nr:hypothetical protein F4677DRAFT_181956 [Hypoxylon crocopeplum]
MSKTYGVVKDTSLPLSQIRDQNSESIISSILDIQKHAVTRENWLKSLECLYLAGDSEEPSGKRRRMSNGSVAAGETQLLRRRYLDPVSDTEGGRNYVAVSYTWQASEEEEDAEEDTVGRYLIESRRTGEPALTSDVRNVVWDRVLNYAEHVDCEDIWIDRECVDQEDEAEQEAAIQSMHLVYSLSRKPIALLTRAIETVEELDLLTNLMCGEVSTEDEPATLDLINDITSNLWWTRAWTFQEDYKASTRMMLLIPHHRGLEIPKQSARDYRGHPRLGDVDGEVCIKSIDFRKRATEFCLSYREKSENKDTCDRILKTAAKYNVLLSEESSPTGLRSVSRSMSPTILSDIAARGITLESDRLAIAANCSGYSTRLDTNSLNCDSSSLSLSILALYLLNGEIIENNPKQPNRGTLGDNIFEYLTKQSLSSFRPPIDEGLTFIKSCRFVDPKLTAEGTKTKGHLWRLGKVIRSEPLKQMKFCTLTPISRFATDLQYRKYGAAYSDLAYLLLQLTYEYMPVPTEDKHRLRLWEWKEWMANEVEDALEEGKVLRLGCLVHPRYENGESPYRAVFVSDKDDDWDESVPSYVFTSTRPAKKNALGDIHKHVSLEVDVEWPREQSAGRSALPPKLYIKRWLNGLCFFQGSPQRSVLFPWPSALLE